ncbi:MAG: Peptidase family S41 [uncultured Thiotrichaceae bacterium]|uniref:Peptidase family S41 n=1 Tax=uncultured Thiotrichaceae bacterium TaxID=298394 RepID=A0A6S6TKN8_9GAMM|nr:MAG: Peptidase family S41 [uncultured Thiotrichaceae bacterium]
MKTVRQTLLMTAVVSIMGSALLTGCGGGGDGSSQVEPLGSRYYGIWEREGYGDVIKIDQSGGRIYQYTRSSCLLANQGTASEVAESLGDLRLSEDGTQLYSDPVEGAVFSTHYNLREQLPELCTEGQRITTATAMQTFEHFQQNFADYYAFFNERGVDWNTQVSVAQGLIHDAMSDEDLFAVMAQMLSPLDDGHVQLSDRETVYRPVSVRGANRVIEESFSLQNEFDDIQSYANALNAQYWENLGDYLDDGSVETLDGAYPDRLIWGTIAEGQIGYLLINSMAFFSPEADGLHPQSNVDWLHTNMPDVLSDLANTDALILDIRSNPGGQDEAALAIASYFVQQRHLFGSKQARSSAGDTNVQEAWIEPASDNPYLKPVILITGEATGSAAEVFTLAMRSLPQVTHIGETTAGMVSDVLEKTLPNGWEIWLANEVYFDSDGVNHEGTGIAPEVAVSTFSLEAISAGQNAALDTALQLLED